MVNFSKKLYRGGRLGKYRLLKKLGIGGYCEVWKALDTVEGLEIALKIPLTDSSGVRDSQSLLREIKLVSQLRHPNILPVKNADIIAGHAVMSTELGQKSLEDCSRPMSVARIINIMDQVLAALAYAHRRKIIHCDITPGNIFLFSEGRALLGDFGIGKTVKGRMVTSDDFGTPGYVAPEQAYGKPSCRSDCFSASLILYEFLTGQLPRWPYEWPMKGHEKLRTRTNLALTEFLHRALAVNPARRFPDAEKMRQAFHDAIPRNLRKKPNVSQHQPKPKSWQQLRRDKFSEKYLRVLGPFQKCHDCGELISEFMHCCPWCGSEANHFESTTSFSHYCPECKHGIMPEWPYCPWCYSKGFTSFEPRKTSRTRYHDHCRNCGGKTMRFMRYCPWCHHKIRRPWQVRPFPEICASCNWSVDTSFWNFCPWCADNLFTR